MSTLASITSKRQLTIPVAVFEKLGFKENSKVVLEEKEEGILVKPADKFLDDLGGSVSIPNKLKGVSAEKAITEAKKAHFGK